VRASEQVGLGVARVKVSFEAWKEGKLTATEVELPVVQGKARVARPVSPQLRATLGGLGSVVWGVGWSADGALLAAANDEGSVRIWDAATAKLEHQWKAGGGSIYTTAFIDSKTLLTSHWEQKVKRVQIEGKRHNVLDIGGDIRLWDLATGKARATLQHDPRRGVSRSAVSPDGKTIAASEHLTQDGVRKRTKARASLPNVFGTPVFSPDGKTVAVASGTIELIDATKGKKEATIPLEKEIEQISALAWSPDGKTLAGGNYQGKILVWDMTKRSLKGTWKIEGERQRVMAVVFSRDSKTLAVAIQEMPEERPRSSEDIGGRIELWDVAAGKRRATLLTPDGAQTALACSPDGKTLASGGLGAVHLWDASGFTGGK
jgi:WD40 repeat protein